ncbi:ATP synthase F1 subunit delta [Anaerocolumna sedimenticola]|uniref:ATP synthase subunit delta n=1 Tax=Anaerocolumna sedimenticola TaxID=2696063 RepID=A0A6P1TS78_9FIRM|nr:ATP synthase F1 subunit delta [Anaerocolumna sedimenticola]QHQ63079.1 ATP synthase F1 subunit delta [Anaerocolumna sedimenticola]
MMTSQAANYAKVLFSLGLKEEAVQQVKQIFLRNHELIEALDNPIIKEKEKEAVIDRIFENDIRSFLKVLCKNQCISILDKILEAYETLVLDSKNIITAKLSYVTRPDEAELGQIKDMLCDKYGKTGVILDLEEDDSLIGGYVLTVGDMEFDKSVRGTISEMKKALIRR